MANTEFVLPITYINRLHISVDLNAQMFVTLKVFSYLCTWLSVLKNGLVRPIFSVTIASLRFSPTKI